MKRLVTRILILTSAVCGALLILYFVAYNWAPRFNDNSFPKSERSKSLEWAQYRFYKPAEIVEGKLRWLLMSDSERAAQIYLEGYTVPFGFELRKYWRPGELKEYLASEGIDFPPGTGAYFSKSNMDLVFVNTTGNHKIFREYLVSLLTTEANKPE